MENKEYFYCYSYKLMRVVGLLGDRYDYAGKHANGNTFWAFPSSETLNHHLDEWNNFKKLVSG